MLLKFAAKTGECAKTPSRRAVKKRGSILG